jgi:hypothetical protein
MSDNGLDYRTIDVEQAYFYISPLLHSKASVQTLSFMMLTPMKRLALL